MKKIVSLVLTCIMLLSCIALFGCASTNDTVEHLEGTYTRDLAGTTLNVYNWGEYISDGGEGSLDVIAAFEKLTGIHVNYVTYESNEVMYSKLKSGSVSYDVIIPSDYMIARMANEGMLKKLDYSKLTNYQYIDDAYKGQYFDPNEEYTAAYNVGMVAMIYNTTMVEGTPDSWGIMWDEKYAGNVLMFNNSRDAFGVVQSLLGIDYNTTDKAEWDAVAQKFREQEPIRQGLFMDEVFNKMEDGNAAIAAYYVGDCITMKDVNPDLEIVYPKEGVNIFVDSMCIPSCAQNYEAALLFINFMMEPEVALANAEYICYASPNTAVINNEAYAFYGNEYLYPAEDKMPKVTYFHDLDVDTRSYYEQLWMELTVG